MGYKLVSEIGESVDVGNNTWILALNLAETFGWTPAGTQSDAPEWDGNYDDQVGQAVFAEDAAIFAESLLKAANSDEFLPTVRSIADNINGAVVDILKELRPEMLDRPEIKRNLIDHESVQPIDFTSLAEFMRSGQFTIK